MPPAKRDDFHRCACTTLRQAARVVTQHFDEALVETGLRITQLSVLTTLAYTGPKPISELAAIMVLDRTTLGRNVRPLQRGGYLKIAADTQDGRKRALALTKKGLAAAQKAMDGWGNAQTRFEHTIGLDDAKTLRKLLRKVIEADLGKAGTPRTGGNT